MPRPKLLDRSFSTYSLGKPRILCLHGGGVSAQIFELQMRFLAPGIERHFRLVYANGPFESDMHPDLKPVYSGVDQCHCWSRWLPDHPPVDPHCAIEEIEHSLTSTMDADEGTGEWVGLIGFSQGAKLALSILLENQFRQEEDRFAVGFAGVQWKFGIIMAGRAPPYSLSDRTKDSKHYVRPGELPQEFGRADEKFRDKLRTPTLHVHGLLDSGLELHRDFLEYFCELSSTRFLEWEGAHRIPFRPNDVTSITDGIPKTAKV